MRPKAAPLQAACALSAPTGPCWTPARPISGTCLHQKGTEAEPKGQVLRDDPQGRALHIPHGPARPRSIRSPRSLSCRPQHAPDIATQRLRPGRLAPACRQGLMIFANPDPATLAGCEYRIRDGFYTIRSNLYEIFLMGYIHFLGSTCDGSARAFILRLWTGPSGRTPTRLTFKSQAMGHPF